MHMTFRQFDAQFRETDYERSQRLRASWKNWLTAQKCACGKSAVRSFVVAGMAVSHCAECRPPKPATPPL